MPKNCQIFKKNQKSLNFGHFWSEIQPKTRVLTYKTVKNTLKNTCDYSPTDISSQGASHLYRAMDFWYRATCFFHRAAYF